MYRYGYKLFLSSVLEVFYKNIFVIVIAKSFSVGIAGLYFFADRIKELLITQLITSIQTVTFPALSVIQNDIDRLKTSYKKILQVMTFIVFPILLIFSALSELIFKVFLPDKWLPSVVYLQLMCLSSLVIPIISINLNIIKVKGYSNWYLQLEILKKVTGFVTLFITIEYGVVAILVGQLVSQLFNYYPSVYMSNKIVEYSLLEQLEDFMPNLVLSLIVASIIWFLQYFFVFNPLIELLVFSCISFILYIGIAHLIKLKSLHLALSLFKGINKKAEL
jgi:O-antigen/teichoic acid export membrane protein